jgi:hypothetical protein
MSVKTIFVTLGRHLTVLEVPDLLSLRHMIQFWLEQEGRLRVVVQGRTDLQGLDRSGQTNRAAVPNKMFKVTRCDCEKIAQNVAQPNFCQN